MRLEILTCFSSAPHIQHAIRDCLIIIVKVREEVRNSPLCSFADSERALAWTPLWDDDDASSLKLFITTSPSESESSKCRGVYTQTGALANCVCDYSDYVAYIVYSWFRPLRKQRLQGQASVSYPFCTKLLTLLCTLQSKARKWSLSFLMVRFL